MIIGALVTGVGVLATFAFANYLTELATNEFQGAVRNQTASFASAIESGTAEFEQILLILAAYRQATPTMTKQQWADVVKNSQIVTRHPFIMGVGSVDLVPDSQRADYQQSAQQELPGFTIFPEGDRELYTTIRYLEPTNEANNRAVGYDMFAEPSRQKAMEKARDKAELTMTAPVKLVQDADNAHNDGVLLYYPVYRNNTIPQTIEARRQNIIGYTYIVMRPSALIESIASSGIVDFNDVSYKVVDVSNGVSIIDRVVSAGSTKALHTATETANVVDKIWSVTLSAYQPSLQRVTAPGAVFILGILTSFAIGISVAYILLRRLLRLEDLHQTEIQRTKNELLALTSHQLRTPASGVKQYIGMLLQGFVGDLTEDQQLIARKAFAANERQLETINQLLHVAKADADQLVLDKEPLDLGSVTESVVDSMHNEIEQHDSEVVIRTRKPQMVFADKRYLRMAIENLISNALKYSDEGKSVVVTISGRSGQACLSVRDYGVGIDTEDIDKLFKKFSRIPNALSKSSGGSGLGLFLAEQIMQAHGGSIEVESKPHRGSIFSLILPRDDNLK